MPREPGGAFKRDPHYSDDQNRRLAEECQQLLLILADIDPRAAWPAAGRSPLRADLALKYLDIAAALGPPAEPTPEAVRIPEKARRLEAAARARSEAERVQPSGATDYFLLGDAMYRGGDLKEALGAFRDASARRRTTSGPIISPPSAG